MPTRRENGTPMPAFSRSLQLNNETWMAIHWLSDRYSMTEVEVIEMILEWVGTSKQRRRWLGLHGEAVVEAYKKTKPIVGRNQDVRPR